MDTTLDRLKRRFVKGNNEVSDQVANAVDDSFKRLLKPSIETEFANLSKAKADEEAIRVFAENLQQLLLAPPLGQKRVLGVDPGYRTGCKLVCLDAQGNLLHNEAIYPHPPQNEKSKAAAKVSQLVSTYAIEAIAIGNGDGKPRNGAIHYQHPLRPESSGIRCQREWCIHLFGIESSAGRIS